MSVFGSFDYIDDGSPRVGDIIFWIPRCWCLYLDVYPNRIVVLDQDGRVQ